jgi:hypothetical protein
LRRIGAEGGDGQTMTIIMRGLVIALLLLALRTLAAAQQDTSTEELAKKTQNPVADLISVPLQNNWPMVRDEVKEGKYWNIGIVECWKPA